MNPDEKFYCLQALQELFRFLEEKLQKILPVICLDISSAKVLGIPLGIHPEIPPKMFPSSSPIQSSIIFSEFIQEMLKGISQEFGASNPTQLTTAISTAITLKNFPEPLPVLVANHLSVTWLLLLILIKAIKQYFSVLQEQYSLVLFFILLIPF